MGFEHACGRWGQRLHEIEHAYNAKGWRVKLGETWQVFVLELLELLGFV